MTGVAPDREDDLVLGTAFAATADFLVTEDNGLHALEAYRGARIVTAGELPDALERG